MSDLDKIRTKWTLQLYKEYEHLCYHYKLSLDPIVIFISSSSACLGSWCPLKRTITISYDLILNNNWAVVIEVLKHEMAHQYAYEIFSYQGGHGREFLQACDLLMVETWARKASINLEDYKFYKNNKSNKISTVLRRAKKLLALTTSCNENEARIALQKVKELSCDSTFLFDNNFSTVVINHNIKKTRPEQASISGILSRFFSVKVVYSFLYNSTSLREERVLEITGEPAKVEVAEYVYWYLLNHTEILWRDHKEKTKQKGLRSKNEFIDGVLSGFSQKLQEKSVASNTSQEKSLVITENNKKLDNFMKKKYPKLQTTYSSVKDRSNETYRAGHTKGMNLSMHHGVKKPKIDKRELNKFYWNTYETSYIVSYLVFFSLLYLFL